MNSAHTSTPPTTSLNVDPTLDVEIDGSNDPLIVQMKNTDRLDRIRSTLRARTTVRFETSPMSRVMRRDWNIVSAKLFLNAIDDKLKKRIADDVTELHWQCSDLVEGLRALPMSSASELKMRPRLLDIQVVHPLAAQWLRSMRLLDECYHIMIKAEKNGVITRKQRWAMVAPAQLAYMGFKASAMNLPLKSAKDLLEDVGL